MNANIQDFKGAKTTIVIAILLTVFSRLAAAPITIPDGLNPGDTYRLVFVTRDTRDATSSDINDYNSFVQASADASSDLAALSTAWTAIGSTGSVDARDNTGTNPDANGVGVPIFNLQGQLLAANYTDLWDGSLDAPVRYDEFGNQVKSLQLVWTGTLPNGLGHEIYHLGTEFSGAPSIIGVSEVPSNWWVAHGSYNGSYNPTSYMMHLYGMSELLIVPQSSVPEFVSSVNLMLIGIGGLFYGQRFKNKHFVGT